MQTDDDDPGRLNSVTRPSSAPRQRDMRLSTNTPVKINAGQITTILAVVISSAAAGAWWLSSHMATKDELRELRTDLRDVSNKLNTVVTDLAVLKDRSNEHTAPTGAAHVKHDDQ